MPVAIIVRINIRSEFRGISTLNICHHNPAIYQGHWEGIVLKEVRML